MPKRNKRTVPRPIVVRRRKYKAHGSRRRVREGDPSYGTTTSTTTTSTTTTTL